MKTGGLKKQHRTAAILAAGFCMICLFPACHWASRSSDIPEETEEKKEEPEITIMHIDAGKKEFEEFLSEAEKTLNIRIHAVECPINADSRHARISSLLAAGDTSVDVISVNDEMISEFKGAGYLEPLNRDVMDEETASHFPQDYLKEMVMDGDQI